jgi:hypothetical protein
VENLVTFDPSRLDLTWSNERWLLTAGPVVLKDFGRKESEGRQALRLVRNLRLNQYGTVGSPALVLEYWLCDGAAPCGVVPGCAIVSFDAAALHVEESLGQWCVRDGRRVLFNFGPRADYAQQTLAILRKYDFTRAAVVGQLTPSMFVFLANPFGHGTGSGRPVRRPVTHESPEAAARKAEELKRLGQRVPGLEAEVVAQPSLRPLRTPDQPRQAFTPTAREYAGEGPLLAAGSHGGDRGERVAFDWRQVEVRLEGNTWKLAAGGLVLANFGADQESARRALDAVRYYHFTELRLVGRPRPYFCYFLVNSLAPHGLPFGLAGEPLQPETLKAREVDGRWTISAGERPLIVLGGRPEEASDLLEVIRRQHFDHLCRIGRPEAGFTFLVRAR